jgi:Zn-dependent protease
MGSSIRLFRVAGIQVYLHFSWFLVAAIQFSRLRTAYHAPIFAILEYLALFAIVLLHEFGHAFACRQVGGIANTILLWPFGGIAFVRPPPRPAAELWAIAAGPLVNVALCPVLYVLRLFLWKNGFAATAPDLFQLVSQVFGLNLLILAFNLMPIYPLDGGQILRSLLWFPLGRIKSLRIASIVGLVGGIALVILAIMSGQMLFILLTVFLITQAIAGWRQAQALQVQEDEALRPQPPPIPRPPML